MIVAGFDEAGYGPKLGPLVVAGTAFEVDADPSDAPDAALDLWERLAPAVRRTAKGDAAKVWVADSKAIKPRKDGLKQLELGVLAFRGVGGVPATVADLLAALGDDPHACRDQLWFHDLEQVTLPAYGWAGEVAARAARIAEAGAAAGVRYLGAEVRVLDARRYNARIAATHNKSEVLGETFVDLLRALRLQTRGPLEVVADKHGGRSHYLRLLGRAFALCPIDPLVEGPDLSAYALRTPQGPLRVTFRQSAEEVSLPVALASMHCKYLREVLMGRFNAWFQERIPGVKPTAGYAQDAGRFLEEVRARLPGLGVSLDTLVRSR